ncbi:MAG: hypothetical protein FJX61_00450 [Alphaproteobacteria bacterium]|nr:hypothetical protein [Alphaproteobacteria bacterium]
MARDKVTIGMAVPGGMTAAYAYLSAASALGYDREVGVEFDFFYGGEPAATAQCLIAGDCTFACLNTIVGLIGRGRCGRAAANPGVRTAGSRRCRRA